MEKAISSETLIPNNMASHSKNNEPRSVREQESYEKYFDPRLTGQNILIYKNKALFLQNQNSEGCV